MSKKIKTLKIFRIDHLPGAELPDLEKFGILQTLEKYDENGHLLLETGFTRDGEISDKTDYSYDEKGRVSESRIFGEDDEVLEHTEVFRDKDGRILKEIVHYLDGSDDIRTYFYDDTGNLTGLEVHDDEDELDFSERYFYEGGQLVKIERYDEEGEVIFYQQDTYQDGTLAQRKIWSSEEEEPFTLVTDFTPQGTREREIRYDSREKVVERNIYEADENGRVIKYTEENRQKKNTTEVEYDGAGQVIYQKETDLNGELNHEIFRKYDEEGRLISTTAEIVQKNSGEKRAYTLVYQYEFH
jgi:YD repeat-containing protein